MGTLLRLAQIVLRTSRDHIVSVLYEVGDEPAQVQQLRSPFDQANVVDREGTLQCGVLVQLVEYDRRHGIALDFVHDPHPLTIRLVSNFRDAFDFLVVDQFGGLANHVGLVDEVGNFFHDDDLPPSLGFFDADATSNYYATTACVKGFVHAFHTVNDAAGWEIRCFHVLHELVNGDVVVVDVRDGTVNDLTEVVGRHVGGHPDRNARSAIHQ